MATITTLAPGTWTLLGRGPMRVSGAGRYVRSMSCPASNAPMLETGFGQDFIFVGENNVWARPSSSGPASIIVDNLIAGSGEITTDYAVSGSTISGGLTSPYGPEMDIIVRVYVNGGVKPLIDLSNAAGFWSVTAPDGVILSSFRIEIDSTKAIIPPVAIGDAGLILNLAMASGVIGPAWI